MTRLCTGFVRISAILDAVGMGTRYKVLMLSDHLRMTDHLRSYAFCTSIARRVLRVVRIRLPVFIYIDLLRKFTPKLF